MRRHLLGVLVVMVLLTPCRPSAAEQIVGDPAGSPGVAFVGLEVGANMVHGTAVDVDAGRVRVVVWALTDYWYPQPSVAAALTEISGDGSWTTWTAPWQNLVAALVDSSFRVDGVCYVHPGLLPGVLAFAQFPVVRADLPVQFGGREWGMKLSAERVPLGPNFWGGGAESIWVDAEGMHLRIVSYNDAWICPEVYLLGPQGYGTYTFEVGSRVDRLDSRTVFRCFAFGRQARELDIEFARADGGTANARFVVQPSGDALQYAMPPVPVSTHRLECRPDRVLFASWRGSGTDPDSLIAAWDYTGSGIPPEGDLTWLFNLWLRDGQAPASGHGDEVLVRSFTYEPLEGSEAPYTVSGHVTLAGRSTHGGVTVNFTRLSGTGPQPPAVQTTASGEWTASGFGPGSVYLAIPTLAGWSFTPSSTQFSAATGQLDFTGQLTDFAAGGRVVLAGQEDHGGVTVSFARLSGTGPLPAATQTDASGAWSAVGFGQGTVYLAIPSRPGWTFTPTSSQFGLPSDNLNFTGQLLPYAASGTVALLGWPDNAGVTVGFSRVSGNGPVPDPVSTDAAGAWSASGFGLGTVYRATPQRTGWSFTPPWTEFNGPSAGLGFTGRLPPYAASGHVRLTGRSDHAGVTITFARLFGSGPTPGGVKTDSAGAWTATGFEFGTVYLATPNLSGWGFVPASTRIVAPAAAIDFVGELTTAVAGADGASAPQFALLPNSPNPFNAHTAIGFALAADGPARLELFDVSGRPVRVLAAGRFTAGLHVVTWDGTDGADRAVASAVYVVRLQSAGSVAARKILLLR